LPQGGGRGRETFDQSPSTSKNGTSITVSVQASGEIGQAQKKSRCIYLFWTLEEGKKVRLNSSGKNLLLAGTPDGTIFREEKRRRTKDISCVKKKGKWQPMPPPDKEKKRVIIKTRGRGGRRLI